MSLYEQLSADNRTAMAVAAALEQAMGPDTILAVGLPVTEPPNAAILPATPRVLCLEWASGLAGLVGLAVTDELARRLEALAPDEELITALTPAFAAATTEITTANGGNSTPGPVRETDVAAFLGGFPDDHGYLVYPLLDGTERIATLVVQVGIEGSAVHAASGIGAGSMTPASTGAAVARTTPAGSLPDLETHQFGQLPDAHTINLVDPRPLSLLHDVEMGVTAELGRRRMTVRDLLSLTPGAVIELDRAAGSPVDVLVNGTLIARGEVVVIDEEFGIRISEIVAGVEAGAR